MEVKELEPFFDSHLKEDLFKSKCCNAIVKDITGCYDSLGRILRGYECVHCFMHIYKEEDLILSNKGKREIIKLRKKRKLDEIVWCINNLNKSILEIKVVNNKYVFDNKVIISLNVVNRTVKVLESIK